jgi:SAM-dependent methyltransferase
MSVRGRECTAEENHLWSLGCFVQWLVEHEPESVLDVGCGSGRLLEQIHATGVTATGLDRAGPKLDELRAKGLSVLEGSAYELPFDDRSVDWVTLRHVPHHLEDPARAFREALRVAHTGVLIAEPSFDASLPSQRTAIELDLWEKRQDRRGGMHHAEVYELGALLAMLPDDSDRTHEVETRRVFRLRQRSIADFAQQAAARVEDLPEAHPERVALSDLLADCADRGLSWNGSLCVTVRRRR